MKKVFGVCMLFLFVFPLFASAATTPRERMQAWEAHQRLAEQSIFKNLRWRNVGPYFMGGRITDIEGWSGRPHRILAASASGGLWLTENQGTTWTPIFDDQASITLGDVAVSDRDPDLIWAGTGEENSSRSSYAGTGVYKSTDSGKSWRHMGLADTHHIAEILIHPENTDIVYVAAMGHLYTDNVERGLYKTEDGGETWRKVLYISEKTGVIDLVMHPRNPDVLYAAAWQRDRKAWNFVEGGPESAVFKTLDGGETWVRIVNGLPQNDKVGRIGLGVAASDPDVIYAFIDNQAERPRPARPPAAESSGLTVEVIREMDREQFLALENRRLALFLKEKEAPDMFTPDMVKEAVSSGQIDPKGIADMLSGGANAALFNTRIVGGEVYRSRNGGGSWERTHEDYLPNSIVNTYGYYFGQIEVSPDDTDTFYLMGFPLMKTTDGGRSFFECPEAGGSYGMRLDDVHPDHHALWIDPEDPRVIWNGNDGGLNVSYDGGRTFRKVNNLPLAQCYTVNFDMETPYRLFSGLQDNGVNMGPSDFEYGLRDRQWTMILGGDGAFTAPDPRDSGVVFAEFQFGSLYRIDIRDQTKTVQIQPRPGDAAAGAYRFNWLSPFMVSRHNPSTLIMGANKVLMSVDRGDHWFEISDDLTDRENTDGDVPFATIVSLDESPFTPQVIYAGTDDGNVWVTRNRGGSWEKINDGLPDKWVTRIEASRHQPGRVYLTQIGYREDDFSAYVFVSEDYGKNWTSLKADLPEEGTNVIREDPENPDILYLGTDLTAYTSLDRGKSWISLRADLPTQAVYDMRIHPRDGDLVIGTHGRGVFILPLGVLRRVTPEVLAEPLHIFPPPPAEVRGRWGSAKLDLFCGTESKVEVRVLDVEGKALKTWNLEASRGLHSLEWDLVPQGGRRPVSAGAYRIEARTENATVEATLEVSHSRRPRGAVISETEG